MKIYKLYITSIIALSALFAACNDSDSFDNKTFINSSSLKEEVLIKRGIDVVEKTLQASVAQPEASDIKIVYKADASKVDKYNSLYKDHAMLLPSDNYTITEPEAVIKAGSVLSSEVKIVFKNLSTLNEDSVYVLPVSIDNVSVVGILESKQTTYYVVKGAALINTVADIEKNNLSINWAKPDVCNNLSQVTMEALFRARDYDRLISTVMGIEGRFLIRLGDANFPPSQVQIATSRGNYPDADSNKALPTNEWIHMAMTYDSGTNTMKIYINGKVQSSVTTQSIGTINLGVGGADGFYIGRSYADDRYLAGEIAECRIWNTVRTQEEIANNSYYIDPESPGLVAYWKFDDGDGNIVKDHTSNGNNAVAKNALKWNSVSLPEKSK